MSGFTSEWLASFHAKHQRDAGKPVSTQGCSDESALHNQISKECLRRGWLAFHGSMAHRTYRSPGEPDFILICDGGRVLLIECKTATGKLSTEQLGVIAWASKLGHTVHVVRSYEEFIKLL